ncbi:MAG: alanine--tRNA ligase [Patescibacteria group bacterium]
MQSEEIRNRFLKFFENRGHAIIPSASLVPENDPSVLFNTAGMQPLAPYLLGETHPSGSRRLVNSQKCVRTVDIDDIGDNTHATFFEMLGNWSLGDPNAPNGVGAGYFKEDAIKWSYEFLTSKEEGLGLDPNRLYVTVFEGDENAPRDEEAFEIWKKYIPENRIYFMSAKSNWWSPGDNGPCGPDTEMFYDVTEKGLGDMTKEQYLAADSSQDIVEIWNDVFMEYEKKDGKVTGKLKQKNVDTGSGLERVAMVVEGKNNIYETDLFLPIISIIDDERKERLGSLYDLPESSVYGQKHWTKRNRIIADHLRTSAFMISDGVTPSNKDRGYVLRRLLRRTMGEEEIEIFVNKIFIEIEKKYRKFYSNINSSFINEIYQAEFKRFQVNAKRGFTEIFKKYVEGGGSIPRGTITGKDAFYFFSTFGITKESFLDTVEDAGKNAWLLSDNFETEYSNEFKIHQKLSRKGVEQKFKGGLADTGEQSIKYHTTTHLLHKALREVLGNHVFQKGSNITSERLRFDFSHGEKMTDGEKKRVEDMVNEKISETLPVFYEDISLAEAKKKGAIGLFEEKYGNTVRLYRIGDFSLEFCGGPHVKNTSELGHFKITKEEAVSAGVRRIKATLE